MVTNCLGFLLVPFLLVFWEFVHFIYFVTQSCLTLHDSIDSSTPGFPVFYYLPSLLKLVHWVGDAIHFILCRPLLPWVFPSIGVFSSESALHIRWVKYRSLSFSISPSNEYSGLISFRMDWLDLFAVQVTPKSLLWHHSSKSILQHSAFFMVQLTSIHDYWKNHRFEYMDLCRQSNASAF